MSEKLSPTRRALLATSAAAGVASAFLDIRRQQPRATQFGLFALTFQKSNLLTSAAASL